MKPGTMFGTAKALWVRRVARSKSLLALCLTSGFIFVAWLGLNVLHYKSHAPANWMATSFLICALVMLSGRLRIATVAVCMAGAVLMARMAHWPWMPSAVLAVLTLIESMLGAWLLRRVSRTPRLPSLNRAIKLLTTVMAPTLALTTGAALILIHLLFHNQGFERYATLITGQWLAGHGMGMVMMLPTLLLLATPSQTRPPRKSLAEKIALALIIAALALAPFTPFDSVAQFIGLPMATIFAFRLGPKLTVISVLAICTVDQVDFFLQPSNQIWGAEVGRNTKILAGQIYLMAVYANAVFTGLAIDYQARVKRMLTRRTKLARRARAQALQASRAKTEFLATMSHEIRTPLNGVLGFAQLLKLRQDLSPEAREEVDLIASSGQALLTVVNDILDFSKVEAGQVTLDPRPVSVTDVAREAVAIVSAEARRKHLALDLTCEGGCSLTHLVDDQRLRQVLINLLNNAVKFTEHGGVAVRVSIRREQVRMEVSDTGVGISADAIQRLFQRFSQADGSISRSHGGTGLGLAISKGLVELMGGRMGVDSVEGVGSTFWLEFSPPIAANANDDRAATIIETAPIHAHILLVDDHPVNRRLGQAVLEMMGCTVDMAENGALAVEAMGVCRYDLVLMDVHMPVMDGLEASRAIRALPGPAAQTPIVTMSADVLPEQAARCAAAGMNDRVPKPLKIDDLQACLMRWVGHTASGAVRAA